MGELLNIPIVETETCDKDTIYFLPTVRPVVYLGPNRTEPPFQEVADAVVGAYTQAARRGEVAILKLKP